MTTLDETSSTASKTAEERTTCPESVLVMVLFMLILRLWLTIISQREELDNERLIETERRRQKMIKEMKKKRTTK